MAASFCVLLLPVVSYCGAPAVDASGLRPTADGSVTAVAKQDPNAEKAASRTPSISVKGNELVGNEGPVVLEGVNRSGTEYACAQGWGIFDGPSSVASLKAMTSWRVDTVRVPLNEDCWLGINVPPAYSGAAYRRAIVSYVRRIGSLGMYAILDLHWAAPGNAPALGQSPMPDAHSVSFWLSVAATFRNDDGVLFELFNEPHGVTWRCWLHGCETRWGWRAVGMQQLVDAVRRTGAVQPIIVDGLRWANNLTEWLSHMPVDPLHELVAGFHVYPWNACADRRCRNREVLPVKRRVPVVTTEVGQDNCTGRFVKAYIEWASHARISSAVWTWNTNEGCHALIRTYNGQPTRYGQFVESALKALGRNR